MPLVQCPCSHQFQARYEDLGQRVPCPACGSALLLPAPTSLATMDSDAAPPLLTPVFSDKPSATGLVERWQKERTRSPEELCTNYPDLLDEVRKRITALASMEAQLGTLGEGPRQPEATVSTWDSAGDPASGPVAAPITGAIPGYEILGELGRGGMGVVYKARQIKANRVVALKMILHQAHATLEQKVRFQIEVEAIARFQHPNIVQLHDVGEHGGLPFFSLEFCDGGGLDKQLKDKRLSVPEAVALVEKLARAMHYAHSRGVVHRDLKPANILLSQNLKTQNTNLKEAPKAKDRTPNEPGARLLAILFWVFLVICPLRFVISRPRLPISASPSVWTPAAT